MAAANIIKGVVAAVRGVVNTVKPNLATFVKYAKVELTPPSPKDIPAVAGGLKNILSAAKTGKWKTITVREAWLNTLVTVEIFCWFYVGECIGKRSMVGYKIEV